MSEQLGLYKSSKSPEWEGLLEVLQDQGLKAQFEAFEQTIPDPLSLDIGIGLAIAFLIDKGFTETEAREMLLKAGVK